MRQMKAKAKRHWEHELMRWEGIVKLPHGGVYETGALRASRKQALQDAVRLKEDIQNGLQAHHATVEETGKGRRSLYDEPMRQTNIWLPETMIVWLNTQPSSMGETIRALIEEAMKK